MKKFLKTKLLATVAAATLLAGQAQAGETLTVYHSWSSPTELGALELLKKTFEEKTGNIWKEVSFAYSGGAADGLQNMIAGGNPPNAFMVGSPSTYRDLAAQGLGVDLADHFAKSGLWDHAFPIVKQMVTIDDRIPMIPLELVTDGVLYYNLDVAKDAGVDPAKWTSLDDMFADFDKIKAKGYIPIAIGADHFQISWLFHTLLASEGGPGVYNKVFGDKIDPSGIDTAEMRATFDALRKMQQHEDPGAPNRKWNDTTNLVITGKALLQIHGNWMKGEFRTAGKKIGVDYNCINVPGAKSVVVATDVLGLINPGQKPETFAAETSLADVIVDPDVQGAFTQAKGATPIRGDVDPKYLDACTQLELDNLAKPDFTVARPMVTTDPDWFSAVYDVADKFWNTPDMTSDQAVAALKDAYDTVMPK